MAGAPPPPPPPGTQLSGLAIGIGFLASAAVLLVLPRLLTLGAPWPTTSRVAAWGLLTLGVAGTGIELERLGRRGFANFGIGLFVLSLAAGMVALATRVLERPSRSPRAEAARPATGWPSGCCKFRGPDGVRALG